MSNNQCDLDIIDKLKNEYIEFIASIESAEKLADTDSIVGGFDKKGSPRIIDLDDVINKPYLDKYIATMSIVLSEKELTDCVYAVEVFLEGLNKINEDSHKHYGSSLYKPSEMILLSLIDRKLRLLGQHYNLKYNMVNMIKKAFERIIDINVNSNVKMSNSQIKLITYTYKKIYYMYDTQNFKSKSNNTINRNCIMHNIVNNNGVYDVAEVGENNFIFLINILFAVCIITETDVKKIKTISAFIEKL